MHEIDNVATPKVTVKTQNQHFELTPDIMSALN